jgi:hypothetical protein
LFTQRRCSSSVCSSSGLRLSSLIVPFRSCSATPLQRHYIGTSVLTDSACLCGLTGRNPA